LSHVLPTIRPLDIKAARERQHQWFEGTDIPFNAAIPGGHVRDYCYFSAAGWDHYKQCIDSCRLSTRLVDRLAKVARTVGDLARSESVELAHVDKAAIYVIGGMLREGF
jgi:magnesium chelatase family protein